MTEETDAAAGSLKAHITADLRAKRQTTIEKIPVPRFNGRLLLRCNTLDDRDWLRMSLDAQAQEDEVEGLVDAAITALLGSCVGSETKIDGETIDLGKQLGLELSAFLGKDAECGDAQTDAEAVVEIFGGEADIVEAANHLEGRHRSSNSKIADDVVGNSEAAS